MGLDRMGQAYVGKVRAELDDLRERGVLTAGNACSSVLIAKGEPGEAELAGQELLAGADGVALRAALGKLGYALEDWCALACWAADGRSLGPDLVRRAVVALAPTTLVATNEPAAAVLQQAFAADAPEGLVAGGVSMVAGMRVLRLDGFEAALGQMRSKQLMWARLKLIPPLGEPY